MLAVAMAATLLIPMGAAQLQNPTESTETTLYFHIFDTLNRFVINTQPMNADFFEVGGSNFPTLVDTPVNDAYGVDWDFNTIYGTSTAGPVEYQITENGKPRFHPERGIAADVVLDQNVQPVTYLYLEVRDLVGLNFAPNFLPAFKFDVNMRTGDDPGKDANYDAGNHIMTGTQTVHICGGGGMPGIGDGFEQLCGGAALDYPVLVPNEQGYIEVAVPMDILANTIPKAEAFNVRLDWYQLSEYGAVAEDQFSTGYLRFNATKEFQPRMELNIMNPVYVEFVHPQVAAGTLLVHTGVNSPWGTYDVDAENMTIAINGPTAPSEIKRVVSKNQHVHGLHDKAAEITYLWKFRDEGADNGEYTIDVSVPNVGGNAVAKATAGFVLEGNNAFGVDTDGEEIEASSAETKDSPAGFALGALGLAALAFRRKP